jgi:hypothetical protein
MKGFTMKLVNLSPKIMVLLAVLVGCCHSVILQPQTAHGAELTETTEIAALIVGVDRYDRTLTLIGPQGGVTHFEAGPDVKNFDQISVGDHVKAEYITSVALYLGDYGMQPDVQVGAAVTSAAKGDSPAGAVIEAVDVSAKVIAKDTTARTVTLEGHDGHVATVQVAPDLDAFETLEPGDLIHARYTKAVAISVEKTLPDQSSQGNQAISLLFVQNAGSISYDEASQTLQLHDVNPSVIFFSDRPYRIAGHVLVPGFIQLWNEGTDSFKEDPPNATLSIIEDDHVHSAVIEIASPSFNNNTLSYRVVKILDGDLPASGSVSSLFIDGLFDGRSGLKGAAGGALIGSISGNAGKGAAIGAAVGVVGGAVRRDQDRQAAEAAQAQANATRVINVPNANGSFTPVTLQLGQTGWVGPRGEVYPTLPTVDQLKGVYAVR